MFRSTLTLLLLAPLLTMPRALPAQEVEAHRSKPIMVLTGPDSAVAVGATHRIMESDLLESIWLAHLGKTRDQAFAQHAALLEVDLDKAMVVAIFLGDSFNCRGLGVESVVEGKDEVRLRFDGLTYQTGSEGVAVRPYAIVVLPRSSKALVIEENVQDLIGKPPVWKEQVRFPAVEQPK